MWYCNFLYTLDELHFLSAEIVLVHIVLRDSLTSTVITSYCVVNLLLPEAVRYCILGYTCCADLFTVLALLLRLCNIQMNIISEVCYGITLSIHRLLSSTMPIYRENIMELSDNRL